MWIKSIELTNVQKHKHLFLEFSPKTNVIHGETDAGKSVVRRAFEWIFFNEHQGNIMIRVNPDNPKKILRASGKITFNTGMAIEKIKSGTENAYILYINGEEKRFDSIGKTVPEEIVKATGIFPMMVDKQDVILNIAPQIDLPFMMKESATFRMKIFNKLTGNDLLDLVIQSFNKDALSLSREQNVLIDSNKEKIEDKAQKESTRADLEDLRGLLQDVFTSVKERRVSYDGVYFIRARLSELDGDEEVIDDKLRLIKYPDNQVVKALRDRAFEFSIKKDLIDKFKSITNQGQEVWDKLENIILPDGEMVKGLAKRAGILDVVRDYKDRIINIDIDMVEVQNKLSIIKFPENVGEFETRIKQYENLAEVAQRLKIMNSTGKTIQLRLESVTEEMVEKRAQYREILKMYGKCPVCNSKITDELLEGLNL